MTISDWIAILAIIIAPLLAVQVQKFIELRKEIKARKLNIFKKLMSTRAAPISPSHVEALNMIDTEFYKDKKVVEVWKIYLYHLANYPKDAKDPDYRTKLSLCAEKSNELLVDLLSEMAKVLNYSFDKVHLKRGAYIPQGHADIELEQNFIRRSIVDVFLGKKSIPISTIDNPEKESKENK
jgi:ankyrin repeat protein